MNGTNWAIAVCTKRFPGRVVCIKFFSLPKPLTSFKIMRMKHGKSHSSYATLLYYTELFNWG